MACALQSNATMKQHSLEGDAPDLMKHFIGLLRNFDAATLITHQGNAALHGRPMAIADVDTDGTLWFVSTTDCAEISESAESWVTVTLQSPTQFVVATGRIRAVRDQRKMDELSRDRDRLCFDGRDQSEIALLSFFTEDAEFWDNGGARGINFVYRAPKSALNNAPLRPRRTLDRQSKLAL
jgi:general stress protein 26